MGRWSSTMTSVASLRDWNENMWQLFINSLQLSLKAVLLHNGNSKPSILIAHCVHSKKTYDNVKILLEAIQYYVHQCNSCGDLKVTGMSLSMQAGFTKFCCLCLWDSCSTAKHYVRCDWEDLWAGKRQCPTLINTMKIFLAPVHIKLRLI